MDYEKKYKEALEWARKVMQGKVGFVLDEVLEKFPELKESEDEKIRKALIHFISEQDGFLTAINGISIKDVLAWLEKQQKSAKNIVEIWKDMRLEVYQQASGNRHEPNYSDDTTKMFSLNDIDEIVEKMSEQSPADKVEPKFHEGEWVIFNESNDSVYQVERIDNYRYYLRHYLGGSLSVHFDNELIRKWTIQDAKAGDVLIYKGEVKYSNEIKYERICLFNNLDNAFSTLTKFSNSLTAYSNDVNIDYPNNTVPATKEQRDTLIQAMADAGYTFDFEKKELKKIEQKPAWSEKDEHILNNIYDFVAENLLDRNKGVCADECLKWLKSLRGRVQPKQEWSEKDEERLRGLTCLLDNISQDKKRDFRIISENERSIIEEWLKSLKERYIWKPSEEQMEALNYVVNLMASSASPKQNDYYYNVFKNLRKQLKELRGNKL